MCYIRLFVARVSRGPDFYRPCRFPYIYLGYWSSYRCRGGHFYGFRISVGTKHTPQVSHISSYNSSSNRVIDSIFERFHRFMGWCVLHLRCSANDSNLNAKDRPGVQ